MTSHTIALLDEDQQQIDVVDLTEDEPISGVSFVELMEEHGKLIIARV